MTRNEVQVCQPPVPAGNHAMPLHSKRKEPPTGGRRKQTPRHSTSTQENSPKPHIHNTRIGSTGAPPWSQAWGWGSQASTWWPESLPTGPGRAQPEMATWARLHSAFQAHHLQEGP
ncbi:hypothetical protein L3Q82_007697 [Scortum barcoo]|uniref:Uncharacterized protein n=1 Tax=Scortum barcoo TaxID=214431 RepID=A0ACB8WP27_9TELE|nr:hypothetical protein L3Q82_007697 [Scortum barcoo]